MKKITFILLALISGTAFGQTASADGQVNAKIVSPISIVEGQPLNFGSITPNVGVVVVAPEGFDKGNTTATVVGEITPSAGSFDVNAANNYAYSVTLPASVTLTATGGATMTLDTLTENASKLGKGTAETFNIGGTLHVANSQAVGNYKGTVTVSVAYN